MAERIAVVDIGTNTLLLLVAEVVDDELIRVHEEQRFGRLGKGLDASGNLASKSIERSLEIARSYRARMDELGVSRRAAVGTQALREAGNAGAFVAPAEEILGATIEVVPGEREAELVALSVTRSMPELPERFVIADVGGGSTEVIEVAGGQVAWFRSLAIGSVRFTERHLPDERPSADQVRALFADIDGALAQLTLPTGVPLVGTAGTATTIATVELHMHVFDPDRVQGSRFPPAEVERQLVRLLELDLAGRARLPGLEPQRADVFPAGLAIYCRLLHAMSAPQLVISDRGVRWGRAYELAGQGS